MPLIAVAPHKRILGVASLSASGDLLGARGPLPDHAVAYEVLDLSTALHRAYSTDAHLVTYHVRGALVGSRQPRINKPARQALEAGGLDLVVDVLVADVDLPGHAAWSDEARAAHRQIETSCPILTHAGIYETSHGLRILQPLEVPIPVRDVEACTKYWIGLLEAHGIHPDRACVDWTRHYRLPHVVRDGSRYRSPYVHLDQMRPIDCRPTSPEAPIMVGPATAGSENSTGQITPVLVGPSNLDGIREILKDYVRSRAKAPIGSEDAHKRDLIRKILGGDPLAQEGERDRTVLLLSRILKGLLRGYRIDSIVEVCRPSCAATDTTRAGDWAETLRSKLERDRQAQIIEDAARLEEQSRIVTALRAARETEGLSEIPTLPSEDRVAGTPSEEIEATNRAIASLRDSEGGPSKWSDLQIHGVILPLLERRMIRVSRPHAPALTDVYSVDACRVIVAVPSRESPKFVKTEIAAWLYESGISAGAAVVARIVNAWESMSPKHDPRSILEIAQKDQPGLALCRLAFDLVEGPTPKWDEFWRRNSAAEEAKALIWSIFETRCRSRQALIFQDSGKGNSGKSAAIKALRSILGPVSAALTNEVCCSKFMMGTLVGKRVAFFADCRSPKFFTSENFRNITSGDVTAVEKKGIDPITSEVYTRVIVGTNFSPEITGARADTSRVVISRVDDSVQQDDSTFVTDLIAELPAMLWKCRAEYRRLCPHHGNIQISDAVREAIDEAVTDHEGEIDDRLNELFVFDPAAKMPNGDFRDILRAALETPDDSRISPYRTHVIQVRGVRCRRIGEDRIRVLCGIRPRTQAEQQVVAVSP